MSRLTTLEDKSKEVTSYEYKDLMCRYISNGSVFNCEYSKTRNCLNCFLYSDASALTVIDTIAMEPKEDTPKSVFPWI